MDELAQFIDQVYRQSYSLVFNNCIHKSLRIRRKALLLGRSVDIIVCISVVPIKKWHIITVNPHMYLKIDGVKVDVSLDPGHEARYCPNSEKKILFPVNISSIGRKIQRAMAHLLSHHHTLTESHHGQR